MLHPKCLPEYEEDVSSLAFFQWLAHSSLVIVIRRESLGIRSLILANSSHISLVDSSKSSGNEYVPSRMSCAVCRSGYCIISKVASQSSIANRSCFCQVKSFVVDVLEDCLVHTFLGIVLDNGVQRAFYLYRRRATTFFLPHEYFNRLQNVRNLSRSMIASICHATVSLPPFLATDLGSYLRL